MEIFQVGLTSPWGNHPHSHHTSKPSRIEFLTLNATNIHIYANGVQIEVYGCKSYHSNTAQIADTHILYPLSRLNVLHKSATYFSHHYIIEKLSPCIEWMGNGGNRAGIHQNCICTLYSVYIHKAYLIYLSVIISLHLELFCVWMVAPVGVQCDTDGFYM